MRLSLGIDEQSFSEQEEQRGIAHPDADGGTTDAAGDPGVRTAAGGSGFRLTGALLSLLVKSTPVSAAFGAYGASSSIYTNFLSRGHDVVFPKDTPIEIGFGPPHASATQKNEPQSNAEPSPTDPK